MMRTRKRILWERAVLVAGALAVAVLFLLPNLLMPFYRNFYQQKFPAVAESWVNDGRYRALPLFDDLDMSQYAGRIREAGERVWPMDPHIDGAGDTRLAFTDTLSFMILGRVMALAGDFDRGWKAILALGGIAWFLSFFFLLKLATHRFGLSVFGALFMTLFYDLWIVWPSEAGGLKNWIEMLVSKSTWLLGNYSYHFGASRVPRPILTLPAFFLASAITIRGLQGSRSHLFTGALFGGFLAYFHADVWSTYTGALLVFTVLSGWDQRKPPTDLLIASGITLLVSAPFVLLGASLPHDLLLRAGAHWGRSPDLGAAFYLVLGLICWFAAKGKGAIAFIGCAFIAIFAYAQVQVVTGYSLGADHWFHLGRALVFVVLLSVVSRWVCRDERALWLALLIVVGATGRYVSYSYQRFPFAALPKEVDGAYDYLNQNTGQDSIVATLSPIQNLLLVAYTHNKTLNATNFVLATSVSTPEVADRLRYAMHLLNIDPKKVTDKMREPELMSPTGFHSWNLGLWEGKVDWIGREWEGMFDDTVKFYPREAFVEMLEERGAKAPKEFPVDFLWVGPFERALMPKGAEKALGEPVYRNGSISIFRI